MLSTAYLLAKFRFDTAENERNFAKKCQKLTTTLRIQQHDDDQIGHQQREHTDLSTPDANDLERAMLIEKSMKTLSYTKKRCVMMRLLHSEETCL